MDSDAGSCGGGAGCGGRWWYVPSVKYKQRSSSLLCQALQAWQVCLSAGLRLALAACMARAQLRPACCQIPAGQRHASLGPFCTIMPACMHACMHAWLPTACACRGTQGHVAWHLSSIWHTPYDALAATFWQRPGCMHSQSLLRQALCELSSERLLLERV
jgi:hypothetical protein